MVGNYNSNGVHIAPDEPGKWHIWLKFYDAGLCDDASTEGELRLRYPVTDIATGMKTLIADAKASGISFGLQGRVSSFLLVSVKDFPLPANWEEVLQPVADAVGFKLINEN